jgi:hypothetical protein
MLNIFFSKVDDVDQVLCLDMGVTLDGDVLHVCLLL